MAPRASKPQEGTDVAADTADLNPEVRDAQPDDDDGMVRQAVAQAAADVNTGSGLVGPQSRPDPGAGSDKVTGVNQAFVNTKPLVDGQPPVVVEVREGETLPDNLVDGERDRLDRLGAFGPHPREVRAQAMAAARAAVGGADVPIAEPDTAAMIATIERVRAEHNADQRRTTGIDPDSEPE